LCNNKDVYYTYILQLSDKTYYTGFSADLKSRINAHQNGDVSQTRKLRPLKLVYYSAFPSKKLALDFEKYLKSHSGFAFRAKHLT
jgi:putative endonuclease